MRPGARGPWSGASAKKDGLMNVSVTAVLLIGGLFHAAFAGQPADKTSKTGTTATASAADGDGTKIQKSPALTGVRHPLYRLRKSDVVDLRFTFSPEFDQTLAVQPDGFISIKGIGDLAAEGLTIRELRDSVQQAYMTILRDPEVTVVLRDFEKPFFIAGGQVAHPGKYELRSSTSVAEAIAIAGGFTDQARHSQVVLFRKISDDIVETHVLNVKAMLAKKNLEEDWALKPGDMLFVPQNRISKIKKFLPMSNLSAFITPNQF